MHSTPRNCVEVGDQPHTYAILLAARSPDTPQLGPRNQWRMDMGTIVNTISLAVDLEWLTPLISKSLIVQVPKPVHSNPPFHIQREEPTLRVSENRVLRRICGPKREEVAGDWKGLHEEELCNLYVSPNVIRVMM